MPHPIPYPRWTGAAVVALLFALAGCSNQPSFTVDYADDADFSSFRSYRWYDDIHGSELAEYRQYNSSDKRVRTYVDRELKAHGLRESTTERADVWVNYHISKEQQMRIDSFSRYPSAGMHGGVGVGTYGSAVSLGYSSGPSVRTYKEGTVVLDIIDARSSKIVWRGIAEGRLKENLSINDKNRVASEVAAELLADFPPRPVPAD
ncbi:MAG: hypothetical protein CME43_08045 [Haliea sp.]|uniref:DUF4136 domain-containing protein n=1 Tax=Haliea sp. TaxID=1932666 RepID=UPI000C63D0C1|nr:DUF4136 domain-containing protein [Haliea sp.]MBM69412.1 hypothetical protein [Haliea sp.]|tara:strand:- start:15747 stop:16361 length:615 start_codon:yes stop_codon:yes gene_type:complete